MKTIPLESGYPDFTFSTTLDSTRLKFRFRWLTRYGYYTVDIYNSDGSALTLGRALHVNINLLAGLNTSIGRIVLEGTAPTIDNLGIDNNLNWYADDE